jgi:divalent metal cation (Fe/Co/Zn/Cd) transporter
MEQAVGADERKESGLHKKALYLSYFTVGYNVFEGLAAMLAGSLSSSIALIGFGLDSFVESLSGGVMIWRFRKHGRITKAEEERAEKKAVRLVAFTFFILGSYVLIESVKKLYFQEIPSPSLFGIVIAVISIIVMPILFYMKYQTGKSINSMSLMADSKQTLACVLLSVALLIGLLLNYILGLWQADPIIGVMIGALLLKEAHTTMKSEELCGC